MTTSRSGETHDLGPAVRFPPPLIFVVGIGLGVLLDRLLPLPALLPEWAWVSVVGAVFVLAGLAMVFTGMLTFRRFRTAVYPNRPASLVVNTGIYARTRNPMYVGLHLAYAGGVLLLASEWAFALLPLVTATLVKQVIKREERHLLERFPVEYAEYCAKVPRWI